MVKDNTNKVYVVVKSWRPYSCQDIREVSMRAYKWFVGRVDELIQRTNLYLLYIKKSKNIKVSFTSILYDFSYFLEYDKLYVEKGRPVMKKLLSLAVIGAAIGATGFFVDKKNKKHVEETLDALDLISKSAENALVDLKKEIQDEDEA